MKVVFDTNCLLRILPKKSPYRCLWDNFLYGKFDLCYTTEILQEYEEVIQVDEYVNLKSNKENR